MRSSTARFAVAISLVALSVTATHRAAAQAPDAAKIAEAKKHMQAGAAFYNDPSGHKCEEAIREFGKAYELSGSFRALRGMAICNLELERDGEAIEQYTKYLGSNQVDPNFKAQDESDLNRLKAAVATVTLSADRPNVKITDVRTPSQGFPVSNRYTLGTGPNKLGLHPGAHVLTASIEGLPDIVWKVEIANGQKYDHLFDFSKVPPPVTQKPDTPPEEQMVKTRPIPLSVYVLGGLTVALTIPTVILGVRALGKASDYKAQNGHAPKATLESLRSDVQGANLITDVFLGATVVSLVTTGVLFFIRPTKMVKAGTGFMVAPTVGMGSGGAVMLGTF